MEENSKSNEENQLELKAIPDLFNKNFFIPDYQRGYRWGERQVEQLMEDLTDFFGPKGIGSFYCLQPVVVRKMTNEEVHQHQLHSNDDNNIWYEVIDGQQRLTSIRVILSLLNNFTSKYTPKFKYTIYYKTRNKLSCIFDSLIINELDPYSVGASNVNDIDSWHILRAAQCVLNWLKKNKKEIPYFTGTFYENFTRSKESPDKKSVQVIWYELRDGSDPNDSFKRLNDKKVSLNNAELIRAMFLSDSAEYECDENIIKCYDSELQGIVKQREQARKQAHIIEQWDLIEKQLRQKRFWAFVKDDADTEVYSSRIEYIFDLISGKKQTHKDELYTYLHFEEMIKAKQVKGLWDLWLLIENSFATLQSWYQNRDYYHKIGYLIAEKGSDVLIQLLKDSTNQTKSFFARNINWRIKNQMLNDQQDDIFKYSYDVPAEYDALKRILFFYNVESTRVSVTQDYFPFELYKDQKWTLEHIHAQNSERIDRTDKKKWLGWLHDNLSMLRNLAKRFEEGDTFDPRKVIKLLESDEPKISQNTYTFEMFTWLFDAVSAYFNKMAEADGGTPEIHNISNMALLSGSENSSISNSVFEVKRQKILVDDAKGEYIPYCTRLVFLKYFNKENEDFAVQQSYYWSENDRKCYENNIRETLKEILSAEDPNNITIDSTNKLE